MKLSLKFHQGGKYVMGKQFLIFLVVKRGFSPGVGVVKFAKNFCLNIAYFFVGKIIYWLSSFGQWTGKFSLGGQINLLGE